MRLFKTRTFQRWAIRAGLSDAALLDAVVEMERGLIDAVLGGHLYKKRVGLPGRGKRGSARTLVATRFEGHWFFLFGFEKNDRDNVSAKELAALKTTAEALLNLTEDQLADLLITGRLMEVEHAQQSHH
jgi:hypothetical protein